ncbi:fimbrial protein [Pseudomonas gelidaquae]|uniref:fimbrial protein n=1 Tax=Pseudomonas sp. IB20 TaxID=1702250 RepID=UPI0035327175
MRINGAFLNTPVQTGIRVVTIPNNGAAYPINITPYILMRNNPSTPIDVRIGDTLGLLRLTATNNYNGASADLTVTYTAANNFTVSPSTCTINNNNPIEINFGDVHQRAIGSDPLTTSIRSDRRLTYACPDGGITTPITITYKGTPSSFDNRLLRMTNADVGTAMVRGGSAVQVGGSFLTRITNSVGGDDVTFSLVRRAGSLPTPGAISAEVGRQAQARVEAEAFARMRTGQTGRVRQTLDIDRATITRPFARRLFFRAGPLPAGTAFGSPASSTA